MNIPTIIVLYITIIIIIQNTLNIIYYNIHYQTQMEVQVYLED